MSTNERELVMETDGAGASAGLAPEERQRLMESLRGEIRLRGTSVFYQIGLLLVTVAMVLLPLCYVAVVGLAAAGWWWYASHMPGMLASLHSARLFLLAYVIPLASGALLLLFMIKPLFARRAVPDVTITLHRQQEPTLFEFVDRIAKLVGAPTPKEIHIDCQANASAGFRRGLLSFFGHDLQLTIGMPLVATMTIQEFAGVLAHEFGHFSQGTGLRLSYLIRRVNAWFGRVVYERDAWDEWISAMAGGDAHWSVALLLLLATLMVAITRGILWVFTTVIHLISSFLLRQMEHDADRYEIQVAGSEAFTQTLSTLELLQVCWMVSLRNLQQTWRAGKLCDDICALMRSTGEQLRPEVRTKISEHGRTAKTGLFDTHPSDRDRAAAAKKAAQKGFVHDERSATLLFSNFGAASRMVTHSFYLEVLGSRFDASTLVSTEKYVRTEQQQGATATTAERFFQGFLHPVRARFPEYGTPLGLSESEAAERLLELRAQELHYTAPMTIAAEKRFSDVRSRTMQLATARMYLAAGGHGLNLAELGIRNESMKEIDFQLAKSAEECSRFTATLDQVLNPAMERLCIARYIEHLRNQQTVPDNDRGEYAVADNAESSLENLVQALEALRQVWPAVREFHDAYDAMVTAVSVAKQMGTIAKSAEVIRCESGKLYAKLTELHGQLCGIGCPYESERGEQVSIGVFALRHRPAGAEKHHEVGQAAARMLEGIYGLYMRLMGDLARKAEATEVSLGLEPLPPRPKTFRNG